MRILVVSAHFPPNFVSGGTLAPQRLARGLAAAGHTVSVYAGWLGDREPLETWTEPDEEGIPVRWIVTTPWTAWDDTRNFDNPHVATDFALHLADLRPDVVHVHSLQSLGVGVVQACVDAGIAVTITMHDFWWVCGRQFLCDRALRPCSLVVSCGMCHCAVDRDWLDHRNGQLRSALRGVSQILAVSQSSAAVLRANGIGTDEDGPDLVVDESGIPQLSGRSQPHPASDHVAFLYTGGSEVLKGVGPLLEAVRLLDDLEKWTLYAHGIDSYMAGQGWRPPQNVVSLPPFLPEEADAVFERADLLILPSVVRESYSLVTREALSRGLPVICTDTLGPEEVVRDHYNGLVVASGDVEALAHAMRAVIEDRQLLHALRQGAQQPVPMRALADQVAATERRDQELVTAHAHTAERDGRGRSIGRVLFLVGIDGAPLRYRAHFPAEALTLIGRETWVRHYRAPDAAALALLADAVVIYRVPATQQVMGLIAAVKSRGVPVFYDVDDLIFDPQIAAELATVAALPATDRDLYLQGVRRYRTALEACDAFIGSTDMLVAHARGVAGIPAHRWSNGVGIGPARCSDAALGHPRSPGPPRVGYMSGTATHDEDWRYVEPAVVEVLQCRPEVELWLGGLVTPTTNLDCFGRRVKRIPMKPWWELPWVLRDIDVNLAPLAPGGPFNEAKSAIKWLEAALTETPTVASPTSPFQEAIEPGRNGDLAASPEDFARSVIRLIDDKPGRTRLGRLARRDALLHWSPHLQARRYIDILERGAVGRVTPSSWTDHVVLDEPWLDTPVEEYIPPDPMVLAPIEPSAVHDPTSVGGLDRLRTAGLRSTVRRELMSLRNTIGAMTRRPHH